MMVYGIILLLITPKSLIILEEIEKIGELEKYVSLIYNEEYAKELAYEVLSKQHFVLNVDKQMPSMLIENLRTKERLKPDFILMHLGKISIIPNVIPVEVDWSKRELHRHLNKICKCLPFCIELFPQKIFNNNIISMETALNIIINSRFYTNILLSPIILTVNEQYPEMIRIRLPIYTIKSFDVSQSAGFAENMIISMIYAIYSDKVEEQLVRQITPVLYTIAFKLGIIHKSRAWKKEILKNILLRSYLEITFTDNQGSLKKKIMSSTYLDFVDVMTTVFSKVL